MAKPLRIGFLMDPLETVQVNHDSTFALMLEAQARGHEVRAFEQSDLYFHQVAKARMRRLRLARVQGQHFEVLEMHDAPLDELDVIFLRKDPPVDVEFVHATQLVELARQPLLVNSPRALRDCNEKLFALSFPELVPPTLVSRDRARLKEFISRLGSDAILKPIDGFGGKSVVQTWADDRNLTSLLEMMTDGGRFAVIAQGYLAASRQGDKRIILVDGEPLGAVLRVPREDDVRANMAAGGRATKTTLTDSDLAICRKLGPVLRERGLLFVGIDVIGDKLIEINVTSPTGIAEIDELDGVSIERRVLELIEQRRESAPLP